jgi:anti-sigma B factor antagonist
MADDATVVKEVRQQDDAVVVSLQGDIDLNTAPEVHKTLVDVCQDEPKRIVVNCRDVSYIDSSGIGTLVEVFRRARSFDGKLLLCCLNDRVYSVLEITRLDKIFAVYKSEAEALAG